MSAPPPGPAASDTGTIEALKRIKATETEWDERIAAARRDAEAAVRRRREENAAAVAAARAEAEADRARALRTARAAAELEAERILSEGRAAAETAASTAGKRPADRSQELLSVVLGTFLSE